MNDDIATQRKMIIDSITDQRDQHRRAESRLGGLEEITNGIAASLLTWMLDEMESLAILSEVSVHNNWLTVETNVPLSTGISNNVFVQLVVTEDTVTTRDTRVDVMQVIDGMLNNMEVGFAKDLMFTFLTAVGYVAGQVRGLCQREPEDVTIDGNITELVWCTGEYRYRLKINAVDLRRFVTYYAAQLDSEDNTQQ